MTTKVVPGIDPFKHSCLACKLDVDDLLDIIYAASNIYDAEHAMLRKGLRVSSWFDRDGIRITQVILRCGAQLRYGTYRDGYVIMIEMSCAKFPYGP
jgi:hypothetical protein